MVSTRLQALVTALALLIFSSSAWSELTASVDRTAVSENDFVTLTIRSTSGAIADSVDLSTLKRDFTILDQRQSSQISIVNFKRTSTHDLTLIIVPNRPGNLNIPAFSANGDSTRPITIRVTAGSANPTQELSDVFLDNKVSKMEAYVQEQIIYTLKIYHAVGLTEANITPLEVGNADIHQLGEQRRYETILKGIRYSVIEINYALFPEKSGHLRIPQQMLTGRTASTFNKRSQFVRARSAEHIINIKPTPASYPADQPWLPSTKLTVEDSWDVREPELQVGEPVTRTFTLTGQGLTAAQLPDISIADIDGIKRYPEQPQTNDNITPTGIIGQRSAATAIVPSSEGAMTMPALTLYWWNTETDQLETLQLAERSLRVLPASRATLDNQISSLSAPPSHQTAGAQTTGTASLVWQVLAALFALLWAITLWLWKRTPVEAAEQQRLSENTSSLNTRQTFSRLQSACRNNQASDARTALIAWFKAVTENPSAQGLEDVIRHPNAEHLIPLIEELQAYLYSNNADQSWNGSALLDAVKMLKNSLLENQKGQKNRGLKPIYPL